LYKILPALAIGSCEVRVPYKLITNEHVIGLPPAVNMSRESLQIIYENMANIKFVGKLLLKMCYVPNTCGFSINSWL